jgi:hypothetical protein
LSNWKKGHHIQDVGCDYSLIRELAEELLTIVPTGTAQLPNSSSLKK